MLQKAFVLGSITLLVMLSLASTSAADDISELKAQIERLNSRLEKMESQRTSRIEKEELSKMMKDILDDAKAAPALPEWMKNLKFFGDFRLRAEHQNSQGRRSQWGGGAGTPKDRNRLRMRLRFGFIKSWWDDQMEVGFRLASGNNNDPTSTNQTMTGDFSKKDVWIDLMYAKYKPNWAKGLEIAGGKVSRPLAQLGLNLAYISQSRRYLRGLRRAVFRRLQAVRPGGVLDGERRRHAGEWRGDA